MHNCEEGINTFCRFAKIWKREGRGAKKIKRTLSIECPQTADKAQPDFMREDNRWLIYCPFFCIAKVNQKIKIRGLRPPTAPYSFAGPKSKQKRACAALGMSGSSGRQHQFRQDYQTKWLPVPRRTRGSCEPLLLCRIVSVVVLFSFSIVDHTESEAPL